jgi:hypothetical protein
MKINYYVLMITSANLKIHSILKMGECMLLPVCDPNIAEVQILISLNWQQIVEIEPNNTPLPLLQVLNSAEGTKDMRKSSVKSTHDQCLGRQGPGHSQPRIIVNLNHHPGEV